MTHCNDQLIDQLLTQDEQEGRCLIPPSTAIRKALLRRTGGISKRCEGGANRATIAGSRSLLNGLHQLFRRKAEL